MAKSLALKPLIMKSPYCFSVFFFIIFTTIWAQEPFERSLVVSPTDTSIAWGPCPEFMPAGCQIAILHGEPSENNADVLFRVPAGAEIPNHYHKSAERMILLTGEMKVTYEGEEPITITEGSYAYGPANKPHKANCGDSPCTLFIAFEQPVDAIAVEE